MKKTLKVARWEIKKNISNKTFLISIILTPLLMVIFGGLPTFLERLESDTQNNIYVVDEIGIYEELDSQVEDDNYKLIEYGGDLEELEATVIEESRASYIVLDSKGFQEHSFTLYTGDDSMVDMTPVQASLNQILRQIKLDEVGIDRDVADYISTPFSISTSSLLREDEDIMNRLIPGVFAGLILFSVFISGTMTFQSATQEKRDKMTEVLLSSMEPKDLMQGKIIGYFTLGMIQVLVWGGVAIIVAMNRFDIPVMEHLLVKELPLMLIYAVLGYLLFSSLFVSMGATINDIYSAGNMQSLIFLIPMMPIFFVGAIIANPEGVVAKVGSYFPLTTSGVMIVRLVVSSSISALEIAITFGILIVTTVIVMKIAGKIFKTALLMYGKNATPMEIWRWIRQ